MDFTKSALRSTNFLEVCILKVFRISKGTMRKESCGPHASILDSGLRDIQTENVIFQNPDALGLLRSAYIVVISYTEMRLHLQDQLQTTKRFVVGGNMLAGMIRGAVLTHSPAGIIGVGVQDAMLAKTSMNMLGAPEIPTVTRGSSSEKYWTVMAITGGILMLVIIVVAMWFTLRPEEEPATSTRIAKAQARAQAKAQHRPRFL